MAKKKRSTKKKSAKVSGSKVKLDGDLSVKRTADEVPVEPKKSKGFAEDGDSTHPANQPTVTPPKFAPEVEVEVTPKEIGTGKPRPFKKQAPTKAKVACVAYGQRVSLKNKHGYSVEADVVKIEEGMVTFRVLGSDARLQKLEAEVLADLQRGGNTVRMGF